MWWGTGVNLCEKNKSKGYSHRRPMSKASRDEYSQPSHVGLLREPPCPGCPPELWGFPGHFQCRESFCRFRNPWKEEWEISKKTKGLEKRLAFHDVSSTGWGLQVMGQKKHGASSSVWSGSKLLILDRVRFVRAVSGLEQGLWAAVSSTQSSTKCQKPPAAAARLRNAALGQFLMAQRSSGRAKLWI